MNSIRTRLTLRLAGGFILLMAVGLLITYREVRAAIAREFDGALIAQARGVASLVTLRGNGELIEVEEIARPDLVYLRTEDFLQIWNDQGSIIHKSESLGSRTLTKPTAGSLGHPQLSDITLPNGRPGRIVTFLYQPRLEDSADPKGKKNPSVCALAFATDLAPLRRPLNHISLGFAILALGVSLAAAVLTASAVRRGLKPLDTMAGQLALVNAEALNKRFPTEGMPNELRPIADQFNLLFGRLKQAFERERRFSADAAHELRTPVAELRTMAEVAIRWPDDAEAQRLPQNAYQVALQMELMVDHLMQLARCQAGRVKPSMAELTLGDVIEPSVAAHVPSARARGVKITREVEPDVMIVNDRALLTAMISNLVGNAAAYAPEESWVHVAGKRNAAGQPVITISNPANELNEEDLPHLGEPFWRKEGARSSGMHAGLGFALVLEYARLTGLRVNPSLKDKVLTIELNLGR